MNARRYDQDPSILEMSTGDFLNDGHYENGPHGRIYSEALDECRDCFSRMLSNADFDPMVVPSRMRDHLEQIGVVNLAQRATREEIVWHYKGERLLSLYGIERPLGDDGRESYMNHDWQGPLNTPVPEEFEKNLLDQVALLDLNFTLVREMHGIYQGTEIPSYLTLIDSLMRAEDPDPQTLLADEIFEKVQHAIYLLDYTLPLDDDYATYLMCYLPFMARRMFKGAMVANQVLQRMDDDLGDLIDQDEVRMRDALMKIMQLKALTGQDWDQFCLRYGCSDNIRVRMALMSAEMIDSQAEVQTMLDEGLGDRVVKALRDAQGFLSQRLKDVSRDDPTRIFTNTDIGHGMKGFEVYGLDIVLSRHNILHEVVNVQKDGRKAMILEDDHTQATRWQELVNRYSPQITDNEDVFDDPVLFIENILDPNVSFYIIDMRNRDDDLSGLGVAEHIVRTKLKQMEDGEIDKDRLIKIMVWSTSPRLVELASDYFRPMIKEEYGEFYELVGYDLLGSSRKKSTGINLVIKHKDPQISDFNDQVRLNR